jgi:hypothetical protein
MQKINIDKQTVIFSVFVFFLIMGLFFLFPWSIKKIILISRDTVAISKQIDAAKKEWPNKDNYLKNKDALREKISKADIKFVNSQQESKLFSFISASSKEFGVEIQSLSPGKVEESISTEFGHFNYLPIVIKAKSRFHSLVAFLNYLQNSQYFFDLKKLNIKSDYPYNSIDMILCGLVKKE